jgi:hypothetical protein
MPTASKIRVVLKNNFQACICDGGLGACCNSILGVLGIFLAKFLFQSSKFSKEIFFTWPLFSHFVINLDWLAGQPI